MNKELLTYIRQLTKSDTKTLSEKALKVGEEFGELARVVLPYDNAFATNYRFVQKAQILEECADVILTAWSVAADLDFTDDDIESMLMEKSKKWQSLQLRSNRVTWPIPFEIHVTVEQGDIEQFKWACENLNLKPILLELHSAGGIHRDLQTSSVFVGDNRGAVEQMQHLHSMMYGFGFTPTRMKLETVPWHPAAPHWNAGDKAPQKMPKNCYFETHLSVIISDDQLARLAEVADLHDAHLSQNVFKRIDDTTCKMMLTIRDDHTWFEHFAVIRDELVESLQRNGFAVDKVITEFSIYDSKISHDQAWLLGETDAV